MTIVPEGRVRDLLSTADRQLATQSYDAAVDTYRTALAELSGDTPAAVRSEVESRLAAASLARENGQRAAALLRDARYLHTGGRLQEAFTAVCQALALEPANTAATQLRAQLLAVQPNLTAPAQEELAPPPVAEPPAVHAETADQPVMVQPAPPPPEPEPEPFRTIVPPSFHLIEDDPEMLERAHMLERRRLFDSAARHRQEAEPPLSILHPPPPPQEPDYRAAMLTILCIVFAIVVGVSVHGRREARRQPAPPPAAAVEDEIYTVADGVSAPVVLTKVDPVYPDDARAAGVEGTVVLSVVIESNGTPTLQSVVRGLNQELDGCAAVAVRQWRFQPGMKDGKPVKVLMNVEVQFPPQ